MLQRYKKYGFCLAAQGTTLGLTALARFTLSPRFRHLNSWRTCVASAVARCQSKHTL